MADFSHNPVMLEQCVNALNIKSGGVYVDATLGRGGHSLEILKLLSADRNENRAARLLCIDRDENALELSKQILSQYINLTTFIHNNFSNLKEIVQNEGISEIDGILFDLGVSSPQLDDPQRGFSYMKQARLDMRMDRNDKLSAYDIVNFWPQEELERIFLEFGEERYSRQIAKAILKKRQISPIETTLEFVDIIKSAMPPKALREPQHPAKRCFQAVRMAVNNELGSIEDALKSAVNILAPGGRIAVLTFHSGEDRLVKTIFARESKGCDCPPDFPQCVCGKFPRLKIITRKPLTASENEIAQNPRSRSAKLRIAEKLIHIRG